VGRRPYDRRISRYAWDSVTADHDTSGPMTRTVTDAAILMGVLEGAAPDRTMRLTDLHTASQPGLTRPSCKSEA